LTRQKQGVQLTWSSLLLLFLSRLGVLILFFIVLIAFVVFVFYVFFLPARRC